MRASAKVGRRWRTAHDPKGFAKSRGLGISLEESALNNTERRKERPLGTCDTI